MSGTYSQTRRFGRLFLAAVVVSCAAACASQSDEGAPSAGGQGGAGGTNSGGESGLGGFSVGGAGGAECQLKCSYDMHEVLDCDDHILKACSGLDGCDAQSGTCMDACDAAANNKQAVGCEYWATPTDVLASDMGIDAYDRCFAAFVANTWDTPAMISVEYDGQALDPSTFGRIPTGPGPYPTLLPFDAAAGLQPGEVAVLFLTGPLSVGDSPCPMTPAVASGATLYDQTAIGKSFRIRSDVPVVAYQMNPYDGLAPRTAAISLLIPTSAWDKSYLGVMAGPYDEWSPSMNIIASEADTTVTMVPPNAVSGGGGIPAGGPNQPLTFTLQRGEQAQITQQLDLTGSLIQADKPIGLIAAHQCMRVPVGGVSEGSYNCDHAAQMIPPLSALGSEFVGVMPRPRVAEPMLWKVIAAVDGTVLTWDGAIGPTVLDRSESAMVLTSEPFVVKSQDADHPLLVFAEMLSAYNVSVTWPDGWGDSDFVYVPPVDQFLTAYTFYALPMYPETNLVVVRTKHDGAYAPVVLDCLGELDGWKPVGDDYEWTRVDLTIGNFESVGGCTAARREIHSSAPFGLWVYGWGAFLTIPNTRSTSYGFPAGMSIRAINDVILPPN